MIRVYLSPLREDGDFAEEIEITSDVDFSSIGKIKRKLDNTEYDVGILRFNELDLKLNNREGIYSSFDNLSSVFETDRSGSKVRITWDVRPERVLCGVAIAGQSLLGAEVDVFNGILNDESSKMNAGDQYISFKVMSYDYLYSKVLVPYASLTGSDTFEDVIFKILNQSAITKYITVDAVNINCAVNPILDDLTSLENKTGREGLESILLLSNSVLYLEGSTAIVKGRTVGATTQKTFYGQASEIGNENIIDISDIRNGQNRIINFVRWKDSSITSSDSDSIDKWGYREKELDSEIITDNTKRQNIADAIVAEFKDPKIEFSLISPLDYETYNLEFLDKVLVDYPSVYFPAGPNIPIVGITKVGDTTAPLPYKGWDFSVSTDTDFKIMGFDLDPKKETIAFNLRGA